MRVPGRPAAFEGGRGVHRHDRRDHRGDPRAGRLAPATARRRFLGAPVRYRPQAPPTPGPSGSGWRTARTTASPPATSHAHPNPTTNPATYAPSTPPTGTT